MTRLVSILFALLLLFASPTYADEITQQVSPIQAEEPKLSSRVTIWRPALLVGDLLEQASEQTGVPIYAEDSDGAACEVVLAYIKDLPLSDLMESLASLLSEKGALWEWRKTTDSRGQKGYRLIRTRQAAQARGRQRNRICEVYLRSVERALAGNVKNDTGAEYLGRFPQIRQTILSATTPEQRREALFREVAPTETDAVLRSWMRGVLFPTLELAEGTGWDLNMCQQAQVPVIQDLANRWTFAGDQPGTEHTDIITASPDDADPLESIARSTRLPVLARRSLLPIPLQIGTGATLNKLREDWKAGSRHPYLSKFRGKSLLISEVMVDDETIKEELRLPYRFYKDLRVRLGREKNLQDSVATLSWVFGHLSTEQESRFAQHNSNLVPMDVFPSMAMTTMRISDNATFSSRGTGLMLGALEGQAPLIRQALAPTGMSYVESPPQVQEALRLVTQAPYSILSEGANRNVERWRLELQTNPNPVNRADFAKKAKQMRHRRLPPRWSGSVNVFLRFENQEGEVSLMSLSVHSPDLDFLPPPKLRP